MCRPSARAPRHLLLVLLACLGSTSPLQAAPDVTPWLSQRAGVSRDDVAALMSESRELFVQQQLPEAAGERQGVAALQFAADAAARLPPEVVARAGGVAGVARMLVAESAHFYSSDVGGALLILSGERRSALAEFIEGQLSPQAASGQASRLLWSVSRANQDSIRFQARERLTTAAPQYLLAAALRGADVDGAAGQSPSDDQLLAVLVMRRGLDEDTASILVAARHDLAQTQKAFDDWQTAVRAQYAEDEGAAYRNAQRAAAIEGVRRAMPFVVLGVVVIALLIALVAQQRAASLESDQCADRWVASATATVVFVGAFLAWISASHQDPIAALRQPVLLLVSCALALVGLLSARSGSNRAAVAGAVRGGVRALPWMLVAALIAAASMFLAETFGLAAVLVFVAGAQAAMGIVLAEDIMTLARRHPGSRDGGHGGWRHFLTVLAVVGAWASLNPLRLAPDHLGLLMPALAVVVVGGLASVVRGLLVAAHEGNGTRRSPVAPPDEAAQTERMVMRASPRSRGLLMGFVVVATIAGVAGLWFHLSRTSTSDAMASPVTAQAASFPLAPTQNRHEPSKAEVPSVLPETAPVQVAEEAPAADPTGSDLVGGSSGDDRSGEMGDGGTGDGTRQGDVGPGDGSSTGTSGSPEVIGSDDGLVRQINADVTPPVVLQEIKPDYPLMARRRGFQGDVVLNCVVHVDGSTEVLSVLEGNDMLTEAAIDAVKRWRYSPALFKGRPVAVYMTIRLKFEM